MPHCVAVGCNFQSKGNKNSDISLHCFPNEKERRAEWERACGRTQLPKYPRLCSRHFSPDDFESFCRRRLLKELTGASGHKRRLKPDAMPTIFPHKAPKRLRQASEKRLEKRQRRATPDAPLPDRDQPAEPAGECEPPDTTLDPEEPDDPPVHVDQPPASVQSSSTATDAATQTRVSTSDAAVQWPRDVHYPIAMDHIYAGFLSWSSESGAEQEEPPSPVRSSVVDRTNQNVTERDKKWASSNKSENRDPLREIPESKDKEFTSSLIVGDGVYMVDLGNSSEFVIDEECILQLFQSCRECNRQCVVTKHAKGLKVTVCQTCRYCLSCYKWTNL